MPKLFQHMTENRPSNTRLLMPAGAGAAAIAVALFAVGFISQPADAPAPPEPPAPVAQSTPAPAPTPSFEQRLARAIPNPPLEIPPPLDPPLETPLDTPGQCPGDPGYLEPLQDPALLPEPCPPNAPAYHEDLRSSPELDQQPQTPQAPAFATTGQYTESQPAGDPISTASGAPPEEPAQSASAEPLREQLQELLRDGGGGSGDYTPTILVVLAPDAVMTVRASALAVPPMTPGPPPEPQTPAPLGALTTQEAG